MDKYLKLASKMLLFVEDDHDENKWLQIPGTKLTVTNFKRRSSSLNNGEDTHIAGVVGSLISSCDGCGETPQEALADFLRKKGTLERQK